MKVALVHEFLTQLGGAERVLKVLHEMYPQAPVYTLVYNPEKTRGEFQNWDIRESLIRHFPGSRKHYKWYLPMLPFAIEHIDLSEYDLVISDSSAFAKGVKVPRGVHLSYCHTPTRYLWQDKESYVATLRYSKLIKAVVRPLLSRLQRWDWAAAQRVDHFVANSREVQSRIRKFYQRDSEVIYPPVDTHFFAPSKSKPEGKYYLTGGRLEPYKKIDLVIECANKLNIPLKIFGSGTLFYELSARAGKNTIMLGRISDEQLLLEYQNAKAFIFPALEDAGMSVVEAMACGTPVIAYAAGGVLEFLSDSDNGVLFHEQTVNSLTQAIARFESLNLTTTSIRTTVERFGVAEFKKSFTNGVSALLAARRI